MYKCCFKNYCLITAYCLTLKNKHNLKSTEHCRNSINNKKGWKDYLKLTTYSKPWSFWEKHTHIKVNIIDIIKIQRSKIYSELLYHTLQRIQIPLLVWCAIEIGKRVHIYISMCKSPKGTVIERYLYLP